MEGQRVARQVDTQRDTEERHKGKTKEAERSSSSDYRLQVEAIERGSETGSNKRLYVFRIDKKKGGGGRGRWLCRGKILSPLSLSLSKLIALIRRKRYFERIFFANKSGCWCSEITNSFSFLREWRREIRWYFG